MYVIYYNIKGRGYIGLVTIYVSVKVEEIKIMI